MTGSHTYRISSSYSVRISVASRQGSGATATSTANIFPGTTPDDPTASEPGRGGGSPPSGPVGVSINAGAKYTNDRDVALSVVWPRGSKSLLIANDGGFNNGLTRALAPQIAWRLDSSGPDRLPKTVYVRFGHSTQNFTDDIVLDETAPTITAATMAAAKRGSPASTARRQKTYRLSIRASDKTSGVRQVQVAANRRRPLKAAAYRRTITVRTAYRPKYVRVNDRAANWSTWRRLR